MVLRQRKGGKVENEKTPASSKTSTDDHDIKKKQKQERKITSEKHRRKKKATGRQVILFLFVFVGVVGSILYHFYRMYGPAIFLGAGYKDFSIEPYQWRKYLDDHDKTILLIGGPHRSGTTIIWKAICSHPMAVGFGDRFDTGADYSEGILFQDVYPAFGVGMEFRKNFAGAGIQKSRGEDDVKINSGGGLGQYALLPKSYVHWTKDNHKGTLDDSKTLSRLMNRFAPHWDSNKKFDGGDGLRKAKVWVEKSPQNIVLSSYLEGIYNMPVQEDGSVGDTPKNLITKPVTKFLFLTRHPIANVLATDIFIQESMGGKRDFEVMLRNYIQMHKYAIEDSKELQSPFMWVKLEDFVDNPSETLKSIFSFLELPTEANIIDKVLQDVGTIKSNPNDKYFSQWCLQKAELHSDTISKYKDEITSLGLGYDLNLCQ